MYYYKLYRIKWTKTNNLYNVVIAKSLYAQLYTLLYTSSIILEEYYNDKYIIEVTNDIILQMIKDNRIKGNEDIFNILIAEDIGLQLIENNIISKK